MKHDISGRHTREFSHRDYKTLKHELNRRNVLIPIFLSSVALVAIVFILQELNLYITKISGSSALIFASFASSAFTLLLMPYSKAAKRKRFVKSYIIAAVFGYLGFQLSTYVNFYFSFSIVFFVVSLLLFETDSEHPPALGIAAAFLLFGVPAEGIITIALGVALLVLLKTLFQRLGVLSKSSAFRVR